MFFIQQSAFQSESTVPLFLPNCSFIHIRLTSYELLRKKEKKLAVSFNLTFHYVDDVLSHKKSKLDASIDLHLEIDNEGRLKTKLYDNRDDFSFTIVNFPFLCNNIPTAPTYVVYISQLMHNLRACISYHDFLERELVLTRKPRVQVEKLKSILRKFYEHHQLFMYIKRVC